MMDNSVNLDTKATKKQKIDKPNLILLFYLFSCLFHLFVVLIHLTIDDENVERQR